MIAHLVSFTLKDGFEANRLNPETFHIPSREELASIRVGTFLKICAEFNPRTVLPGIGDPPERFMWENKIGPEIAGSIGAERFWVKVLSIRTKPEFIYRCEVANDLIYTKHHGLYEKVQLDIGKRHILEVLPE